MVINERINVKDNQLMEGLIPLVKIMSTVNGSTEPDLEVDFSRTKFISPVFALSLIVYLSDCGISLLGSYQRLPDNEIVSDLEAIKAANRGLSSKNLPNAENRGYGIRTSKRMLTEGLGGQFLMLSGNSFYLKTPGFNSFYSLPGNLRLSGTVVALRIPYNVNKFNYINYIE